MSPLPRVFCLFKLPALWLDGSLHSCPTKHTCHVDHVRRLLQQLLDTTTFRGAHFLGQNTTCHTFKTTCRQHAIKPSPRHHELKDFNKKSRHNYQQPIPVFNLFQRGLTYPKNCIIMSSQIVFSVFFFTFLDMLDFKFPAEPCKVGL